jgi:hypothetical protein
VPKGAGSRATTTLARRAERREFASNHDAGAPFGSPLFRGKRDWPAGWVLGITALAGTGDDPYAVLALRTKGEEARMTA